MQILTNATKGIALKTVLNKKQKNNRELLLGVMVKKRMSEGMTIDDAIESIVLDLAVLGGCVEINSCSKTIVEHKDKTTRK